MIGIKGCTAPFHVGFESVHEVEPGAWEAHMRLTFQAGAPSSTAAYPEFPEQLLERLPSLRMHLCDNGTARSFEMELQDTELAHAFEHTVLELLAKAHPDKPREFFTGKTGFNFAKDGQGVFRVVVCGFFSVEEVERIVHRASEIILQSLCNV